MVGDVVTIARGKTFEIKEILKRHGFQFDGESKQWVCDPPIDSSVREQLMTAIRRHRSPTFDASTVEIKDIRREWI